MGDRKKPPAETLVTTRVTRRRYISDKTEDLDRTFAHGSKLLLRALRHVLLSPGRTGHLENGHGSLAYASGMVAPEIVELTRLLWAQIGARRRGHLLQPLPVRLRAPRRRLPHRDMYDLAAVERAIADPAPAAS
jgi:hypothetical protein